MNKNLNKIGNTLLYQPEMSAHSGDVKLYLPSIMFRNMIICLRCQNGGQPTSNVNIMTPHAQLDEFERKSGENTVTKLLQILQVSKFLTYLLPLSSRRRAQTYYI